MNNYKNDGFLLISTKGKYFSKKEKLKCNIISCINLYFNNINYNFYFPDDLCIFFNF